MARRDDDREESPLYIFLALAGALGVILFLTWIVASNRIVYGSLAPALAAASLWKVVASDFTYTQWNQVVQSAQSFAQNPTDVGILQWAAFITTAARPLAIVLMVGYLCVLVLIGFKRKPDLKRRITPDSLMAMSMQHFTGIAPVVAIRKLIASDKHPKWRRQVTPEEVFTAWKVPQTRLGATGSLAKPGMPMLREGAFDREVARAYFIGAQEMLPDGRLVSSMLGRQIVNMVVDGRKAKATVFADRMSSEGKVLAALWAAVAFGGPEGRNEYWTYRDKLNLSAYGSEDGIANLSVAQPLYEKYRKHPMLNKLFAVHHWEHTFLFALLALAQKKGRYTTAEVLWLRPLNRVMFFSLNSRGSYTPHTEAASTFAQHAYETVCAKLNRLPLMDDGKGVLTHVIYIDKAVDGLELECLRWLDADEDEDDDWWARKDIWERAAPTVDNAFKQAYTAVPTKPMPGTGGEDTAFDVLAAKGEASKTNDAGIAVDEFTNFLANAANKKP